MSIFKKKNDLDEDDFIEEFHRESVNTIEERLDAALPLVKDLTPEGYAKFRSALDNIYAAYHLVREPEESDGAETVPVEIGSDETDEEEELDAALARLNGDNK